MQQQFEGGYNKA